MRKPQNPSLFNLPPIRARHELTTTPPQKGPTMLIKIGSETMAAINIALDERHKRLTIGIENLLEDDDAEQLAHAVLTAQWHSSKRAMEDLHLSVFHSMGDQPNIPRTF